MLGSGAMFRQSHVSLSGIQARAKHTQLKGCDQLVTASHHSSRPVSKIKVLQLQVLLIGYTDIQELFYGDATGCYTTMS